MKEVHSEDTYMYYDVIFPTHTFLFAEKSTKWPESARVFAQFLQAFISHTSFQWLTHSVLFKAIGTSSKRGGQRQCQEARNIFLHNPRILLT